MLYNKGGGPQDEDDDLIQGSEAGGSGVQDKDYILIQGASPQMTMGHIYIDGRKKGSKVRAVLRQKTASLMSVIKI